MNLWFALTTAFSSLFIKFYARKNLCLPLAHSSVSKMEIALIGCLLSLMTDMVWAELIPIIPTEQTSNNNVDNPSCYNLTEVFSPIVDFGELFANYPKGGITEYPFANSVKTDFMFSDLSVSMKNDENITFIFTNETQIAMSLGKLIELNGKISFNDKNTRKIHSVNFKYTFVDSMMIITMNHKAAEGEMPVFDLIPRSESKSVDAVKIRNPEKRVFSRRRLDNEVDQAVHNYAGEFRKWLTSKMKTRLNDAVEHRNFKNNLNILKRLPNEAICMNKAELVNQPKWREKNRNEVLCENVKTYFTSLIINKFQKIDSIAVYNNTNNNHNRFKISTGVCSNAVYDCETFFVYHRFDLKIINLEGEVQRCRKSSGNENGDCTTLKFTVGSALITGIATKTAINIENVDFFNISLRDENPCKDTFQNALSLLLNVDSTGKSLVNKLFAPLRRTDERSIWSSRL